MNWLWHHYALLFATCWCLGEGDGDRGIGLCSNTGELPAPEFFLSETSARKGDRVSARCLASYPLVTNIFFCKDGRLIFAHKTMPHQAEYTLSLNISLHSAGQYHCGYQQKDGNNPEENSTLSAAQNLTVLPGSPDQSSGSSRTTGSHEESCDKTNRAGQQWAILSGVAGFSFMILAQLIYLLIKKVVSHQRSSRKKAPNKHISNEVSEEQLQYGKIVRFCPNVSPPSLSVETTAYAAIVPPNRQPGLNSEPASQTSDMTHEVTSE